MMMIYLDLMISLTEYETSLMMIVL